MPEFAPGESKVALATFPVKPAGLPCTAELWLASNGIKVATSGEIPFVATGLDQSIALPITMPDTGTFPVHLGVFSNGQLIYLFRADEDVVIVSPVPAEFIYASDVREWSIAGGIAFSVDIKNIGGTAGSCSATAYIGTSSLRESRGMGTKTIGPGETATFSGIYYTTWITEPWEWYRTEFILSGAGPISFEFGRSLYLVSIDIPPQIVSGEEYWATMVVHLPYASTYHFTCSLGLVVDGSSLASSAAIGGTAYGFPHWDIQLTATKDYTIRGVYRNRVSYPAVATRVYYRAGWKEEPLSPGIYDIAAGVYKRLIVGPDEYGYDRPCWSYIVGQVEVV